MPAETVEFIEVIDGDGLRVRRAGRMEAVRLACVDCEEALHADDLDARDKPQTVFGEATRLWLAAWLETRLGPERTLRLEADGERLERDGFGRLLAHVILPDGSDLGLELVARGRSPYFTKYGRCARRDRDLRLAESAARTRGLGLWSPATNRPAHPAAPAAQRDYARLCAWWELRAAAVDDFRATLRRAAGGALRGDQRADLQRAARSSQPPLLFVEVVSARRQQDGALRLSCAGDLLVIQVAAGDAATFAHLDLERRPWSGHQNYLWIRATPVADGQGFRVRCSAPGELFEPAAQRAR